MSSSRTSPEEVRTVHVATGVLGHCHSSACVEVGATHVLCVVRPPQQLVQEYRGTRGRVACQVHSATTGAEGTQERDMALALEGVAEQVVMLDTIPQLLVEVVLEIVSDEGGAVWDAACTAMSAALAVGGFAMLDLFSACTAGLLSDGMIVCDLSPAEERDATAVVTVCVGLSTGGMPYMMHRGSCEVATLASLVQAAMKGVQLRKAAIQDQVRQQLM